MQSLRSLADFQKSPRNGCHQNLIQICPTDCAFQKPSKFPRWSLGNTLEKQAHLEAKFFEKAMLGLLLAPLVGSGKHGDPAGLPVWFILDLEAGPFRKQS